VASGTDRGPGLTYLLDTNSLTPDATIAATALVENAALVTRDQNMLDKVPEVHSLNPFVR